jgi:GTPase SAR1 family protein
MSHQQQGGISQVNNGAIPWWVRLCRWLWKLLVGFLGIAVLLELVVNVVSTWLTTSKGALPDDAPLHFWLASWPLTVSIGCCLLLLALLCWVIGQRSVPPSEAPFSITPQDRRRVVNRLHAHYQQMLAQSLQGAVQIELGLASRPAAIQNVALLALRLPEQAEQMLPAQTSIVEVYELARQELLVLGEPGAGKSTLLLELAHHLIEQAQQDPDQPIPVLLPLSSWATNRRPLQEWFIEQFTQLYTIPKTLSVHWVQARLILPLLDGLDEMEESARPACIAAINSYQQGHLHPLVVCSRTAEYDAAARDERLTLQGAVVVQPLMREQVDTHLATLGKPFAVLRTALKKNPTLAELATTPLMLQILMLTYHGTMVRQLSQKTRELQHQIWTAYVERMIERKGDRQRYPLDRTRSWLQWLAGQMRTQNQTIFFLELMRPDVLPSPTRKRYRWINRLLRELFSHSEIRLDERGRFSLFSEKNLFKKLFALLIIALWGGILYGVSFGLVIGLVVGLVAQLVFRLNFELIAALPYELAAELFFGMLFGMFFGMFAGPEIQQLPKPQTHIPNEGIKRSFKTGMLFFLIAAPVAALVTTGPFAILFTGPVAGLFTALFTALVAGLSAGLFAGLGTVLEHFLLRIILWRMHLFPPHAVSFLEDATARMLLRRVGGGYSFTHRLLLEYFADLDTSSLSAPSPTIPPPQRGLPPKV